MAAVDRYIEKAREEFKVRPVLPLGQPMEVGVIGRVTDGAFHPWSTTDEILGLEPGTFTTSAAQSAWQLQSGRDVSLGMVARGQAGHLFPNVPSANARAEIEFSSDDAFLMAAKNPVFTALDSPKALADAMLVAQQRGDWQDDYVLVYQVVKVDYLMVLRASGTGGKALIEFAADVDPAGRKLADLAGSFSFNYVDQSLLSFEGTKVDAFFNAYRVRESLWSWPSVETFRVQQGEFFAADVE